MGYIHYMNLRNLDLNLLLVFEAVYSERSITKAAEKLALSQPAVSNALNRLRAHLDDPLFERRGKGIAPTHEASRLAPVIYKALKSIEVSLENKGNFDPESSVINFKIMMSDAVELQVMHPLIRKTVLNWPGISYTLLPASPQSLRQQVLSKEIHMAVFVTPINDDIVRSSHLFSTEVCVIARADHPELGDKDELTEDAFFNSDWVLIAEALRRASNFHQEAKAIGRSRRIVCEAARMMSLPYMVAESNLIAVVTRSMAEALREKLNLKLFDIPFAVPKEPWHLIWHNDYTDDEAHRWLRKQMKAVVT